MRTQLVVRGLVVDEALFGAAAQGVAAFAPEGVSLDWERFVSPAGWLLIPDERGELSKAELTLVKSVESTVKLNVWFRPDVRGGVAPAPHSHPWVSFTGHVLAGGYSENRWWLDGGGCVRDDLGVAHRSPAANTVDHDTFHEVCEVHEPGRTLSLMVCGRGQRGDWGYLDTDTGEFRHHSVQPVAGFDAMFAALNPHVR